MITMGKDKIETDRDRVEVRSHDGIAILSVFGELAFGSSTCQELNRLFSEGIDEAIEGVVIDLSNSTFVDGDGLQMIIACSKETDAKLVLVEDASFISRLYNILEKLDGYRAILPPAFDTLDEALEFLKKSG